MTRLVSSDVAAIGTDWGAFESALRRLAGVDLIGLCASALGVSPDLARRVLSSLTVAVVPDPSGEGVIEGFSESLVRIALHLGAQARLVAPGQAGFAEARLEGAALTLSASDDDFLAVNAATARVSENGQATGRVYAEALVLMAGGAPIDRDVLVVGAGPVGRAAAAHSLTRGGRPVLMDLDSGLAERSAADVKGARAWTPALGRIPEDFRLIVEASTAALLWPADRLQPGTIIAAPGMPRAIPERPWLRQWHDPLVTGTAMMILEAAL
jgi:pyrrolysine biosynthesis protein PylD